MLIADKEIVLRVKRGEERIFDMLFKHYFSRLCHFVVEYVADEEVAKNLIQDTFVTLWNKKEEFDDTTNLNAWLYSTAKNLTMNYLRNQKVSSSWKQKLFLSQQQVELNYYSLAQFDTTTLTSKEIEQIIKDTLEQLPAQCRKVFSMSRFENMKNREIAHELDISIKTVETHLTKGLKSMRIALKDYLALFF